MGKFLIINDADFSNVAIGKVFFENTKELIKKAFLLSNYTNSEGDLFGMYPTEFGRGMFMIKKTDTNIPLNFDTDYSYIPILGDIKRVSVEISNDDYQIGLCIVSRNGKLYDSNWQNANQIQSADVTKYLSETQDQLYLNVLFKSKTNTKFTNETLDSLGFKITIN